MLAPVDERVDDSSEREKTLIDHAGLASTLILGTGPADVLGSSQVDEVKLADLEEVLARRRRLLNVDGDREDGMRAPSGRRTS